MKLLRRCVAVAMVAPLLMAQITPSSKTYLVKLGVPVSAKESKTGDRIRAAVISPESFLNGYLEGKVEEAGSRPNGKLVLRFTTLQFKGKSTPLQTEVVDFVNSKGHKAVDDAERPVRIENGALLSSGAELWFDEGSELRVRITQ